MSIKLIGQADKKIIKELDDLNYILYKIDPSDFYRKLQPTTANTHSFQVHMEHLPKLAIFWSIKQVQKSFKD